METKFFSGFRIPHQFKAAFGRTSTPGPALTNPQSQPQNQATNGAWILRGNIIILNMTSAPGITAPAKGFRVFCVGWGNTIMPYGYATTSPFGNFQLCGGGIGPVFIMVADLQLNPVYKSPTPFFPVAGMEIFQTITLTE
jgi:hypothetical protein